MSATRRSTGTTEIVSAYAGNNSVAGADLPALISPVFAALVGTISSTKAEPEPEPLVPAVPVKTSICDDHLIGLEDGTRFKSLKRHLMAHHDLTREAYGTMWKRRANDPMVAPNDAATRSALAKTMGLGRKPRALALAVAAKAAMARSAKKVQEAAEEASAAGEPCFRSALETVPRPEIGSRRFRSVRVGAPLPYLAVGTVLPSRFGSQRVVSRALEGLEESRRFRTAVTCWPALVKA